jgi:hypothetical protein
MKRIKLTNLILLAIFMCGCSFFKGTPSEVPFVAAETIQAKQEEKDVNYLGELGGKELAEKWKMDILNYSSGYFTFPPPAGYKVLDYLDSENNVSLDMYRESVEDQDLFMKVIKQHQSSDHCELYDEKFTSVNGAEIIEVEGNCNVWKRGDLKGKYYFVRLGPTVYTVRLLSDPNKDFGENLKEFNNFILNMIAQMINDQRSKL